MFSFIFSTQLFGRGTTEKEMEGEVKRDRRSSKSESRWETLSRKKSLVVVFHFNSLCLSHIVMHQC